MRYINGGRYDICFQNWRLKQEQIPQLSKLCSIFYGRLNIELKTYTLPAFRAIFSKVIQLIFHVAFKINSKKYTLARSITNHPINSEETYFW